MKEKIKEKKDKIIIGILILLICISNVRAIGITSNEVTYEEGKTLTETIDDLYTEMNTYKTGGTVTADKMLSGYTTYKNGTLITGTIEDKSASVTPGVNSQKIDAGYYPNDITVAGVTNLSTSTVKCNQTIAGVKGTCTLYEKIASESLGTDKENGIKYDEISSDSNGKGIYTIPNTGVHFYRGAVDNNHVIFNNICWRIVRTTNTGGVKLIYDGLPNSDNKCNNTGDATQLDSTGSTFNLSSNKPEYAGWKYTEGEYHGTSSPSTIYSAVNTWYTNNMSSVQSKLESTIWCSDRRAYSANTAIPGETGTMTYNVSSAVVYVPYIRANKLKSPSLECPNSADQFPGYFGLITSDEVMYAGGVWNTNNTSYYLYTGKLYCTLSPAGFTSSTASVVSVYSYGLLSGTDVSYKYGVRPMVSLASSAIVSSGNGSSDKPYIIN